METNMNTTTEELNMVGVLKTIWVDLGDIIIFLAIILALYYGLKFMLTYLNKKNIKVPILSYVSIAIITMFTKKITSKHKDGEDLKTGTSELLDAIKEDLKKEGKTDEN